MQIHIYAKQGNIAGVALELANGVNVDCIDKHRAYTPLMYAVDSSNADIDLVQFLVENGANVNYIGEDEYRSQTNVLSLAVQSGNINKIKYLLDAGANINYQRDAGYDALIDATHGRDIVNDENLLAILKLLINKGAKTNGISSYGETALKTVSRVGRFDAVSLLLAAGADYQQLKWTKLMQAIVFNSVKAVKSLLISGVDLQVLDHCQRTPLLLSIQVGDLNKVKLILASDADKSDRGLGGYTALIYAIRNNRVEVLQWLIKEGFDFEATDDYGTTPLIEAAEYSATDCVRLLLEAGANPAKVNCYDSNAIKEANNLAIVKMLVDAGEDLSKINYEMRRLLTGISDNELEVSREQYFIGKYRQFGKKNPEIMEIDFWKAMIRCGFSAWGAKDRFDDINIIDKPIWCSARMGRTITQLPDGRIVEIAGDHEDSYDEDFCIYNDVVVYDGKGNFQIFGYPEDVFPPTDFHSATLVGEYIYIIGSIGYYNQRIFNETPVYRLHIQSFKIEKVATTGSAPGWISRHKALYIEPSTIYISGGEVYCLVNNKKKYVDNLLTYSLDLITSHWTIV
ncbi:ankyrin [Chondrocystis sp. NIES-4102]|nr:ankyrin [Chondrocystis sp. NIES-4102]